MGVSIHFSSYCLCLNCRVSSKAFNYSTSCQPSLEGDISNGEVHEESQMQQAGLVKEHVERSREELISKTRLVQNMQSHLKPDQEEHLKQFPLKVVVQSCVKRWFKEHLRNAEKGDSGAQVMVGQMISHGYGVPKDVLKGKAWIKRGHSRQSQIKELCEKKRSEEEELYFM
ncbi:hypothetical protein GOP47_0017359 [Adiantum capillus-veneris]|uniref:Uncharacterized protein n=1 Tax=Adiantum capillus-veneris TaxID=13818 RepID=A0A9D4UF68_ADICA|nr:hypothetical protein GOP47_0017359 [Adiantum capillus-veneris]